MTFALRGYECITTPKNLVQNELLRTRSLVINTLPLFMTLAMVIVPKLCFTSSCGVH